MFKKYVKNISGEDARFQGLLCVDDEYTELPRDQWDALLQCTVFKTAINNEDIKASSDGVTTIDNKAMGTCFLYGTCSENEMFIFGGMHTPTSATDVGVAGMVCFDASYIYVCTATDTWKRVALATW